MKRLLFALLFIAFNSYSQDVSIIPKPAKINIKKGSFKLDRSTVIVLMNKTDETSANFLNDYLQKHYGFKLKITKPKAPPSNVILLSTWNDTSFKDQKESYQLIVDPKFVSINANAYAGTFYGIQSLIQLLPVLDIEFQI